MADASLDDFFAKKDKSKKKPKVKTGDANTATATAAPKVKKDKKKDKDKINTASSTGHRTANNGVDGDEDWNDFEEEKAVDYTGLRIQNLQIAKDESEREGEGEEEEYDEDGEVKERRDASGPWRKGSSQTSAPAPAPVEAPKPKEEPTATPKAPAKYVPPGQRNSANNTPAPGFPMSRRKREAPNLSSEVDFPTLGGEFGPSDNKTAPSFVAENPSQRRGVNLTLENKFSLLQD